MQQPPSHSPHRSRSGQDWRALFAVFWVTQLIESYGVSQIFAMLPAYLRQLGVPDADRLAFVGLFSSLVFIIGLPLVPLWGVWADKYSRKLVIVRSALVEAAVFGFAALAQEPWQVALALLGIGFQLGNTGVMLAGIRDVTPRHRLGTTIALFGAAGPIGFALGPAAAGFLIDGAGWSIPMVFALSSVLSIGSALLITFGSREVRPEVIPVGPVLRLAGTAMRGVLADPVVRRLFAVSGVVFLANQMSRPYTPLLVEHLVGPGTGLASSIGLVVGFASLVGAVVSPAVGWVGDRAGFRPVLIAALLAGSVASLAMPAAPVLGALAAVAVLLGAAVAAVGAMVFSLLATEVPPERRSATLNLVYLPLYIAGIVGPAIGGVVASAVGAAGPFIVGSIVFLVGAVAVKASGSRRPPEGVPNPGGVR